MVDVPDIASTKIPVAEVSVINVINIMLHTAVVYFVFKALKKNYLGRKVVSDDRS